MRNKFNRTAKDVINNAPRMKSSGLPNVDDGNGKLTQAQARLKEDLEGNVSDRQGIYTLVYMVWVPENPNGRGEIRVELPNKKEYNKVRRQLRRKRKLIKFTNQYGEPQIINISSPSMIFATPECYVISPDLKDDKGRPVKIILPNTSLVSRIH